MRRAANRKTINPESLTHSLLEWFSDHARDLPWRHTDDPYAVWVSEVMLQQTQVKTVIPYWERWMRELPTVESLAQAPLEKILKLWEGLGYYTRVRNMQKAAQAIVAYHNGKFPEAFESVLDLPGIGRYTAGAICSIAFNQPTPILDGNVIRVLTRVYGISENPRDKKTNEHLWALATSLVRQAETRISRKPGFCQPSAKAPSCSFFNQSMMELGALICTPREPKCDRCPIQKHCVANREKRVEELPNLGKRIVASHRRFAAFIVQQEDKFLVRQRPSGVVNAHLWEFPNVEINEEGIVRNSPFEVTRGQKPFCTVKHSITRYRICLNAFHANLPKHRRSKQMNGTWCSLIELQTLPFPSAHKKILEALLRQRP